jgi:hypothetical protein
MKQYLLSAALILALGFGVNAQNTVKADYRFVQGNVPYQEERGDTVITTAGDDNVWPNISIGFDFTYNGVTYSKVAVANNGFLAFTTNNITSSGTGSSILSASIPTGISLSNFNNATAGYGYGPMVAGLNYDLLCDVAVGAGSVLSLTRTGSAPNRKAVFQWKDYRKYGATHTGDNINFQIILSEGSGDLSVHIGSVTYTGADASAQSGLRGNDTTDVLSQSGTWSQLSQNTYARDGILTSASAGPASGTLFTWSPSPPAAIDVSITGVLRPVSVGGTSCISSATDSVKFNLFNNGTNPVSSVPVSYTVNGGSPITETFTFNPPLASRSGATLTFSSAISLTAGGSTTVRVYSSLAGELPATQRNDTLSKTVTFNGFSGSTSIYPLWSSDFDGRTSPTYPTGWIGENLSGNLSWRVDSAIFDPGSSLSLPLATRQGPGVLVFPSVVNTTSGARTRVSTQCLNLNNWPSNEPIWFVFDMNQDGETPGRPDSVLVQVAVNGQNFTNVGGFGRYDASLSTWEWSTFGVDLSAYRNQVIRVAFVGISKGGNNLGIDYARVQNTVPVGLANNISTRAVDVYPNPTTGLLNISLPTNTQYSKVEVLNMVGQIVLEDLASGISQGNIQLDLSSLPKGAYQVRVLGNKVQYQQRITKQ